jgi:tryptophan halogenase
MTNALWDQIRQFLGVHYKFNRRMDTPFWRACRADADIGDAQAIVDYYTDHGPVARARQALLPPGDIFGMEGYLTHLVGQQVPTRAAYTPTPHEQNVWSALIEINRKTAAFSSLDVREAYQRILSPQWRWDPAFYRNRRYAQSSVGGPVMMA